MFRDRPYNFERDCVIETNYIETSMGSCLITMGKTKVICTCSVDNKVPSFLEGNGSGWLTAEYSMLPGSTTIRKKRDLITKDSRSVEIQRLIGRSLRQAINLELLGERTLTLDCDVIQADGGTRTASITGAYVALALAIDKLIKNNELINNPLKNQIAAISVGFLNKNMLVDLCYDEDRNADADINIVMNDKSNLIEFQGTGENSDISTEQVNEAITAAKVAILRLMWIQRESLIKAGVSNLPKPNFIIASTNNHKISELSKIFQNKYNLFGINELGFKKEIIEDGKSFCENSQIKADIVCKELKLPTIADDSGLCVEALNGEPGIFSARFGGEKLNSHEKNMLLLSKLDGENNRRAYFECCMSISCPNKDTISTSAICDGEILLEEVGNNGFGYDPIFLYHTGIPMANMSEEQKNEVSHRGLAAQKLMEILDRM